MQHIKNILKKIRLLKVIAYFVMAFTAPLNKIIGSMKNIRRYRNKYRGKRCFIIGNGPSLTAQDLSMLRKEITFGANKIYSIFDKTCWRPTFYCIQDIDLMKNMGGEMLKAANVAEASFIRMQSYNKIKKIIRNIKTPILVPIYHKFGATGKSAFTDKANKYIYDGNTVTFMAMELAAYMGFSEIYLIGVDHNYPIMRDKAGNVKVDKTIPAHFYDTVSDNFGDMATSFKSNRWEQVTESYQAAENFSHKTGNFRIYNATRGGKLEVFERVDFDSLFDEEIEK